MTDSISVIGPGWRATDSSGNIITDGILEFYDAGTSNARTVYSDSGLSASLGATVDCNSGGYPVTSGDVRTLIYTGATAYKIKLTSVLEGGTVFEHDNVLGALNTSAFLTSATVADQSVVNISTDRSITASDKGKLINMNCSGGALTATFADAATLGDGFFVGIQQAGTANQVKITGDGTDTFAMPGASPTGFSLMGLGHTVWIACDGTNFKVHSEMPPLIGGTSGIIVIADRTNTPPGSPTAGARYIITSSPTGDWSGFAEHDIAEADGFGNWFNYTPATDAGWIAYVQDEDVHYAFRGTAWDVLLTVASDTVAGAIEYAVQSEMETASSATLAVTPGRQHFHPGHPKAWLNYDQSIPAIVADVGVSSVTNDSTGDFTVTWDTAFSNSNYAAPGACYNSSTGANRVSTGDVSTLSTTQRAYHTGTLSAVDSDEGNYISAFGDQ